MRAAHAVELNPQGDSALHGADLNWASLGEQYNGGGSGFGRLRRWCMSWIVMPIVSRIINNTITYLGKDMVHELDDLERTVMPQLRFVTEAAERSPCQMKLQEAFYDAEDLLDMLEYKLLRRKATNNSSTWLLIPL
uniref:Rx N-terminal domain-containing protein n=1 Tax=Leersia perrieri TaxID=77586 RepID=A0A0D9XQT0_9ORYZ